MGYRAPAYYSDDDVRLGDEARKRLVPKPILLDTSIFNAICNAIAYEQGSVDRAAKQLGLSPQALRAQMRKYGIPRPYPNKVSKVKPSATRRIKLRGSKP